MMKHDGGSGRDDQFRTLYQKYYWRMVRYFQRISRLSQEDAEELTQEAFLRFLEAMDEYRGEAEWAYFEVIAQRVLYNRIRANSTAKRGAETVPIDDPSFRNEPAAPEGQDYAERQEVEIRRKLLHDAIAELSSGQRQCILLWLEGFKYKEIATTLRTSMDAVKSRMRDAKALLGARLGHPLPEDEQ